MDSAAKCTSSSTSQACAQDAQQITNAENALTLLKAQQANSAYVDPGTIAQDQEAVTQAKAAERERLLSERQRLEREMRSMEARSMRLA